ncbi:MFS transporter [Rhodopseudomonas sp. P2A-2r]|uniref:MFS transporter n=1 Tax=Rhodopseudomonas sp. P2A-2r TaxID=2991972 RepID=UPI002234B9DD|nr:MFS transporter [Rhodopseudomonas sp. P2A-2r]UZE48944.1 MFS transporter [Rhodopseudomonas sp. P2A-2r]
MSTRLTGILAVACGLIAANIYYAQPLAGPIGAAVGLPSGATGLIVTLTQIGYGAGLLLVVPLGDLVENRRLVLGVIAIAALALFGAALASSPLPLLAASLAIGVGSVAVQILVPYAAHLAPEAVRGRVVGNVMGGLMLGIMLARPAASLVAALSSWPVVFVLSAAMMVVLAIVLRKVLPRRVPHAQLSYRQLLTSMAQLVHTTPVLRRRALYQACLFASFSLFWTVTPLLLAGPAFRLSQTGIGLFALAGVAGAIAAPIAGRLADRGWTRAATALAMAAVAVAFVLTWLGAAGSPAALTLLVVAAIVLDFGVSANLVLGQRAIFALGAEQRGRLNGIYMATFFAGGAIGSALGGWTFAYGGWALASSIGIAFPIAALAYFATEG